MTIIHKGIRRKTTDIVDDYGLAYYAQNVRFKRVGELDRRGGLGKADVAKATGIVTMMTVGNWYEPFIVRQNGGTIQSFSNPQLAWAIPVTKKPGGRVGQAAAPTIVAVTPNPASGTAYQVGQVSFTATIAYDNLSGALTYAWTPNNAGPAVPVTVVDNANPAIYDFDAFCIPGDYTGFTLTVTTQFNGFSTIKNDINFTVS